MRERRYSGLYLRGLKNRCRNILHPESLGRLLGEMGDPHAVGTSLRIEHAGDTCDSRSNLLEKIHPFAPNGNLQVRKTRRVSAWMGQARNKALADRLYDGREYDWNRARGLLYGAQVHGAVGRYYVWCEFQQFCRGRAGPLFIGNGPTIVDLKIATDAPTEFLEFLAECRDAGLSRQVAFGEL